MRRAFIFLIASTLLMGSCEKDQPLVEDPDMVDYTQQMAPASSTYNLQQAMGDNGQLMTIAFSGLAFITGHRGGDSFFPPGKVADYFGFQYMRDIDVAGYGHNTQFLSRVANNVLYVLEDEQKDKLIALAKEQAPLFVKYAYNRFPLMDAFRRNLEGDIPAGATGLSRERVAAYSALLYRTDADLSYDRALMMGALVRSLKDEQKEYLAAMEFNDFNTWPDVPEDSELKRSMSNTEFVAVMTYASEFFSWYKGGVNADIYFCPERHGTYFGGFFLKDYPAMNNPDYFIPLNQTGECGAAFLETLTAGQRDLITSIVTEQKSALAEIAQIRENISRELRKEMNGQPSDRELVYEWIERYGELEGSLSGLYAIRFAAVNEALTEEQRATLRAIRNLDAIPDGAYRFSSPVPMPVLPNTDYLFGIGDMPADAGNYTPPAGF